MDQPLLSYKNKTFPQLHEELGLKIQQLKNKNDHYQRLTAEDLDPSMESQIQEDHSFLNQQIDHMKNILGLMEDKFKDPQSRHKIKSSKYEFEKQMQRYKVIMDNLMEKSFLQRRSTTKNRNITTTGNKQMRENGRKSREAEKYQTRNSLDDQQRQSVVSLNFDHELQKKLLDERNEGLVQAGKKVQNINEIMHGMAQNVKDHGEMIDIIGQNMLKAKQNVQSTNDQLDSAKTQQKKARKKWIILVILVCLLVLAVGGIYLIVK